MTGFRDIPFDAVRQVADGVRAGVRGKALLRDNCTEVTMVRRHTL